MTRSPAKRDTTRLSDVDRIKFGEAPDPNSGLVRGLPVVFESDDQGSMAGLGRQKVDLTESAGELGKADRWGVRLEDRIHVLEEDIANDPGWEAITAPVGAPDVENTTNTHLIFTSSGVQAKIHISRADGPDGTTKREGDGKGGGACCACCE